MSEINNEKINKLFSFIEVNNSYIILTAIIMIIAYFYFRNKVKIIYLLDSIVLINFIFILYVFIAPHRYYALSHFLTAVFR